MPSTVPFTAEGGCDCRLIRYRLESKPLITPAFEEYYERESLWPQESLARRRAILPLIEAHQAVQRADS